MKKKSAIRLFCCLILLTYFIPLLPLATGDGIPAITYGEGGDDPQEIFSSIFESRQLARVELLNDTHERISLFLSVYSLDPGDNLSILVPLRTLPVDVSGKPMKETDFREEYSLKRAGEEVIRQDMDKALKKFGDETKEYFEFAFGSMVWTFPGEYTRQNIHRTGGYKGYLMAKEGLGDNIYGTPQPIQHYEFDGFCIDVFGVNAGPILSDYLEEKGLYLPDAGNLERYDNQYIAVIESESKPPISETKFNELEEMVPNTLEFLKEELRDKPDRNEYQIQSLKWNLHSKIYDEVETSATGIETSELQDFMDELVDTIFGKTNFEGEVLQVDLPLDEGKIFFPLGTSGGWPNNVGDINILFKVPEDKALTLPHSKEAFFQGSHWYLILMENSNPDFDLESNISPSDPGLKSRMEQAAFLYDNSTSIGLLIIISILITLWLGTAYCLKLIKKKKDEKIIKNPILWLFLGFSLLISIPGALLVLLIMKPIAIDKLYKEFLPSILITLYPISIFLFLLGVLV